ncbi:Methionine aminopeptidase 1B, chloroplastic [Geranomyces variabilis]|uniref:Methionine aminopeptidase 1B, chloroplastic n=1 Tax=Geranomyces variabilis TaxID=109894 RepID=A0AAD5TFY8_9FUNG|nr:Methionine aminopeptidase 1B, chloroplastic [Geranomyces variabilis]
MDGQTPPAIHGEPPPSITDLVKFENYVFSKAPNGRFHRAHDVRNSLDKLLPMDHCQNRVVENIQTPFLEPLLICNETDLSVPQKLRLTLIRFCRSFYLLPYQKGNNTQVKIYDSTTAALVAVLNNSDANLASCEVGGGQAVLDELSKLSHLSSQKSWPAIESSDVTSSIIAVLGTLKAAMSGSAPAKALQDAAHQYSILDLVREIAVNSVGPLFVLVTDNSVQVSSMKPIPLVISAEVFTAFLEADYLSESSLRKTARRVHSSSEKGSWILYSIKGAHAYARKLSSLCDEDVAKAIKVALEQMEIHTDCLLVIGSPDGLETDFLDDIYYMARSVGVTENEAIALRERSNSDMNKNIRFERICKDCPRVIRVRLLFNPDSAFLEKELDDLLANTYGLKVEFGFSGHGSACGCIHLRDGDYSGWRLRCAFDRGFIPHHPMLRVLLNCCYATAIADDMIVGPETNQPPEYRGLLNILKGAGVTLDDISEQKLQEGFVSYIKSKLDSRLPCCWNLNGNVMHITPASVGPLAPDGVLSFLYDLRKLPEIPRRPRLDEWRNKNYFDVDWDKRDFCRSKMPAADNRIVDDIFKPFHPTSGVRIRLFQCGNGDSTLLQTPVFSMLIDGGPLKPGVENGTMSAWRHIRNLSCLDLVVLTHADRDHVEGLLALIQFKRHFPKESPQVKSVLVQADTERWSGTREAWNLGNHLADLATEHVEECHVTELKTSASSVDPNLDTLVSLDFGIKIRCVLPNDKLQKKAAKKLAAAPARSVINNTGIVLLVEIEGRRLLFTGDADGNDIAEALLDALPTEETPPYEFAYVDIPHHGASTNHTQALLDVINARRLAVSTNGKNHGHPARTVVTMLSQYLIDHTDSHLYLNHQLHFVPGNPRETRNVQGEFNEAVRARVHLPEDAKEHIDIDIL